MKAGLSGMKARKSGNVAYFLIPLLALASFVNVYGMPGDSSALQTEIENARRKHDIRKSALPAYVLTGSITLRQKNDGPPSQGKFRLVATPDGKWKEEVALPGLSRTRIGDGKQFLESGKQGVVVPIIYELDHLLYFTKSLNHADGDSLKSVKATKSADKSQDCVKRSPKNGAEDVYCFDSQTGDLISHSAHTKGPASGIWEADSEEFGDYQAWGGKTFPRTLRAFKNKQSYVEAKLDEFKPAGQIPEHFFDAATDAVAWGDCDERSAWTLDNRVQPHYPESARNAGQQGKVTVYAIIEPDGHIGALQVVASAGKELDDASLAAASKWSYKATGCSGAPGHTATFIDVIFSLQY